MTLDGVTAALRRAPQLQLQRLDVRGVALSQQQIYGGGHTAALEALRALVGDACRLDVRTIALCDCEVPLGERSGKDKCCNRVCDEVGDVVCAACETYRCPVCAEKQRAAPCAHT